MMREVSHVCFYSLFCSVYLILHFDLYNEVCRQNVNMKQTMCKLSHIKKFDMCCPCAAQLQETQLNARIIPADDDCVSVSTFTFLVSMVRAQD